MSISGSSRNSFCMKRGCWPNLRPRRCMLPSRPGFASAVACCVIVARRRLRPPTIRERRSLTLVFPAIRYPFRISTVQIFSWPTATNSSTGQEAAFFHLLPNIRTRTSSNPREWQRVIGCSFKTGDFRRTRGWTLITSRSESLHDTFDLPDNDDGTRQRGARGQKA
jgi:hypothetical protein